MGKPSLHKSRGNSGRKVILAVEDVMTCHP